SFGGYTVFAIAGGPTALGTFTDPRVRAIMPQAPAAPFPTDFFATITIPTLIAGGSIDETTPFDSQQLAPYEALPAGAQGEARAGARGGGWRRSPAAATSPSPTSARYRATCSRFSAASTRRASLVTCHGGARTTS